MLIIFSPLPQPRILLIYTGGTIGMQQDELTGQLRTMDFGRLRENLPELKRFDFPIESVSFETPVDSSDISPTHWQKIAQIVKDNYANYSGFVVLHGSDTMSFTASALSFMFENLAKPIILTGSQLPLGMLRTDAKENLITAIEIAATSKPNGEPLVPEVTLYFEYQLYRGNRSHKFNAEDFEAFRSVNYPNLAEAGVTIRFNEQAIMPMPDGEFAVKTAFDNSVCSIRLFPGMNFEPFIHIAESRQMKAIVFQSYGSGNAPQSEDFEKLLSVAKMNSIILLNTTQCLGGTVSQGLYETSSLFLKYDVISGEDITFEAAIAKVMFLLGNYPNFETVKKLLTQSLRGEMS